MGDALTEGCGRGEVGVQVDWVDVAGHNGKQLYILFPHCLGIAGALPYGDLVESKVSQLCHVVAAAIEVAHSITQFTRADLARQ